MNRLLHQARQMHQRRTTYFYLSPTESDYAQARMLASQLSLNLSKPIGQFAEDAYDEEDDNER